MFILVLLYLYFKPQLVNKFMLILEFQLFMVVLFVICLSILARRTGGFVTLIFYVGNIYVKVNIRRLTKVLDIPPSP